MNRWSQRMTFRARLTLWWTLAFGVLMAAANMAIYTAFQTYLDHDLDLKVRTVAATELASSTDRRDIHLHELPREALAEGEYTDKFVQIFEADGRVRLFSESLRGLPALVTPDLVRAALDGRAPLVSVVVGGRPGRAAVLGARMRDQRYAVLVGMFRDQVDAHLARLAWLLVAVWAGGLGATSALGYWLASAALAPVVGITRRAARIAKGEFSARLDPPPCQDEVGQMTQSLNEVLERLHGALEAHRRFASDTSHELRTPITAMAGEVDVTLRHPRTAEEYREALLVVRDRLSALTALCEDLVLLVHAQEGARGLELREVSLLRQLQDGATRLAGPASSRDITIETRNLPDLVAYADPRLLARVFDNVLANAVRYNRNGGAVIVSGSAEESAPDEWKTGAAVITVTDTGPGIPPGEWERVFDRFYRLDQSRARQTGGSGLGLAICREVLTVLGGSIRITESSAEGTTFQITVPGRMTSHRRFSQALA
ncbi:MAG: HAMP domain-containing protein [Acidobacteria bacterium]|nr:MAG: HAMP domain-containing protein [Acidobacteriota bacterium]